jgi:hypothetical protein|nr:MAG TPA: hypothetical protein [Caudoviricetes sp.]
MQNEKEFTQICKEILALSEKIKELNLSRLETISVEIKLAKNSFDNKSGEMDAKIAEFNAVAQRLEPLKQSLAKAEEILAKIKENGAGVSEEKAKQLVSEAVSELASAVEELKQKTPIDDTTAAENKTFSSKKIDETYAKKGETSGSVDVSGLATKEELNAKIGEAKANELITTKTANLANKTELNAKLDAATYNSEKANYALKSQLSSYASKSELNGYTVAQNLSGNTIDFTQGVNFVGQNISGQLTATNITAEQNRGKSGLIYIHGNGVMSLSSDFQIINPDDATYGKGYVFLSYFINPFDNKIIVQFIKKAA